MNFNVNMQTQARFKLVKGKQSTGEITQETPEFCNLVLDQGLVRMFVGAWSGVCQVGSGSSTPTPSQTQLDNKVAHTSTWRDRTTGVNIDDGYYWGREVYRFNAGVATGNLSEIALGWSTGSTDIWNRSLIKDINGDPTTITVATDEFLDVFVEYRLYVPKSFTGDFNLLDKNNNIISSHTFRAAPKLVSSPFYTQKIDMFGASGGAFPIYTGDLPTSPTADPTGNWSTTFSTKSVTVTGLGEITGTVNLGLDDANISHRTIAITTFGFMSTSTSAYRYYVEMTPPINLKTNERTMSYTFKYKIERYTGE